MIVPKLKIVEEADSLALSKQWIEYCKIYMTNISSSPYNSLVLNELNFALSRQSFLGGNVISVADKTACGLLSDVMGQLSFQEKEKLIHLSRWYATLQNYNRKKERIKFSRTLLYC